MGATNKYQKLENFFKLYATLATSFLLALFMTSTFFPVLPSGAITCEDGSTGTASQVCDTTSSDISVTVENPYYITVTSSAGSGSGIALDYTAESGNKLGTVVTATDTVKTTSNTGQIKHLYISTSSSSNSLTNDDTDLENNKTYISAGGGDTLNTATSLTDNTWGFNIENNNNFTKVPILGNDIVIQEEIGTENEETGEYESTQNVYFGTLATSSLNAGKYSNTILYTAFTTEPPEWPKPLEEITYMQEMSTSICNNLSIADTDGNNVYILKDNRDEKAYMIARLADNNCWMVQNLAYDTNAIYTEYKNDAENGNKLGNYYTWSNAISVCPSGWRLPASFATLGNKYGIDSSNAWDKMRNAPLYFPAAGYYRVSYVSYKNARGVYWTRSASGGNYYYMIFGNGSYISSDYGDSLGGFSVRCVFNS